MANARTALWLVVYTAPFDEHKFKHAHVLHTADDELYLRKKAIHANNPDWKIVSVEKIPFGEASTARVQEVQAKMAAQGEGYRIAEGDEWAMTEEHVAFKKKELADLAKLQSVDAGDID